MELFVPERRLPGKVASFAARAKIELFPEDSFQQHSNRREGCWQGGVCQPPAQRQTLCFITGCEKAIVANFSKARGQDMQKETPNKLFGIQRHEFELVSVGIVTPAKSNFPIFQGQDPVVRNSHTVGITAQIRDYFSRTVKGRFAVDQPFLPVTGNQ